MGLVCNESIRITPVPSTLNSLPIVRAGFSYPEDVDGHYKSGQHIALAVELGHELGDSRGEARYLAVSKWYGSTRRVHGYGHLHEARGVIKVMVLIMAQLTIFLQAGQL